MSEQDVSNEIALLEQLMEAAKQRRALTAADAAAAVPAADSELPKLQVQTFNAISPLGLERFPKAQFLLTGAADDVPAGVELKPHVILLRSHALSPEEVSPSVCAVARCGAGTNNVPVDAMTSRGVPVFNTPGANANSVKELVLCALFLASRGVVEGIQHAKEVVIKEEACHKAIDSRLEKDKSRFVGREVAGKTLAVLGLGSVGGLVAEAALALGMNVVGYDPYLSLEAAWQLSSSVKKMQSLVEAVGVADYVTIHMPYIVGVTHHCINAQVLNVMKPTCHLLNFARGEIVDGVALAQLYRQGHEGKYIADFPDEDLQRHPKFIHLPHLGACTTEAEDNCARMAADQVLNFLETGTITNSVNFPRASLPRQGGQTTRLCVINRNLPGVLGEITTLLGNLKLNIAQELNTSRGAIAYNVLDVESCPVGVLEEKLSVEMLQLDAVLSMRIIRSSVALEGPAAFFHKN